jgi:rod shape-determining protein MreD
VRIARLAAGFALALLIHLVGMRLVPDFSRYVDVFLVALVLHALSGDSLSALLAGLAVGLVEDSLGSGPFGLYGFADTAVGYAVARLAQRLVIQRATGILSVVAFAAIAQQAVLAALAFLCLPNPALSDPLAIAVQVSIKAAACGVLGVVAHAAAHHWRRSLDARRRGRIGRLKLG